MESTKKPTVSKNFLNAVKDFRELKALKDKGEDLQEKLVWNPETNRWLATSFFSIEYITFRKLEVVAHG